MILVRESFLWLFGDWMLLFSLEERWCLLYFYLMCYARPKYYIFKLSCTFYFMKLLFILKCIIKGFHKNILWILLEVPSGFLGKWINRVLGLSFGHPIIDILHYFSLENLWRHLGLRIIIWSLGIESSKDWHN